MDIQLTNLERNHTDHNHDDNHQDEDINFRNQCNPGPQNFGRDLGIKIVLPEYDGRMQPKDFMDWLVCRECVCSQTHDGGAQGYSSGYQVLWNAVV